MLPLRIAARNTELTAAAEADIRDHVARLARFYKRIEGCTITVDVPERHRKSQAKQYRVRLELTLPGGEVVVNRQPHDELRTAVQDAFAAVRRRLEDYARRQRGSVKTRAWAAK